MPVGAGRYADPMPAPTAPEPRAPRLFGGRSWPADAIAMLIAVVAPTIGILGHRRHGLAPRDVVAIAVYVPLVLVRRRWPLPVFAIGAVAMAAITAISAERTLAAPASVVLLFSMANRIPRNRALVATVVGIALMFAAAAARLDEHRFAPDSFAMLAWFCLAFAAADALRNRREYIAAIEERARRAEETRETEARRRVVEERLHIARELHDVVAHHMAVINVQAGVASHLLRADPDGAEHALAVVRDSGRSVLDELGGLLDVLRNTDDGATVAAPAQPLPTLRDLDSLVTSFADAGLRVRTTVVGQPGELSDALQLTVHRIVEEALTNAQKHGDGSADLRLTHGAGTIDLYVENTIAARATGPVADGDPDAARVGHGTVGMRERVASMHGRIEIGPVPGGRFVVHAVLPLDRGRPV
jgi:signal transduction histidine kinase